MADLTSDLACTDGDRLRALLRADMAALIDDAHAQPDREPDTIEAMLGIDPNDTVSILAAHAVQARHQRDDTLRSLRTAGRTIAAVKAALLAHPDDLHAMADAVDDALGFCNTSDLCDACGMGDRLLRYSKDHGANFCMDCFIINNPGESS